MMSFKSTHYVSVLMPSLLIGFFAGTQLTACSATPAGLLEAAGSAGTVAEGGSDTMADGGDAADAGDSAGGASSGHPHAGAKATGGATSSGGTTSTGGSVELGGNATSGGDAGSADTGGADPGSGGSNGVVIPPTCLFHTDALLGTGGMGGTGGVGGTGGMGGTGGTGGTGGASATVTLQVSPFVGNYLADATGRTLYTYGADLPGDCHTPPVSQCITDCLLTWPVFPAGARILASGLSDGAFGAILRNDGTWQTTYQGWPLYYYKTDLLLGQVAGQGKGKTWHVAQQTMPGVVIMKLGTAKYLADGDGHTLYVSAADQVGDASSDPVSNCSGACLDSFEPFHEKGFSVVTSLLIADFAAFVRHGKGGLQEAYKGMPLYRAGTDLKAGDMTGVSITGFTAAMP